VTGGGSAGAWATGRGASRRGPEGRGAEVGRYGGRDPPGRCGYCPGRGGRPGVCVRTGCDGSGRGPPGGADGRAVGYPGGRGGPGRPKGGARGRSPGAPAGPAAGPA